MAGDLISGLISQLGDNNVVSFVLLYCNLLS